MKCISRYVSLALLVSATFIFNPAQAASKVADCLQMKFPSSTTSSTQITLTAKLYQNCTSIQLGSGNGQRALYTVVEESGLLSLAECNGPFASAGFGVGSLLGTISCTFPISQSFLVLSELDQLLPQ